MVVAWSFAFPESAWSSIAAALVGSLFGAGIVAFITQYFTGKRERRNRRDELRLELYLDVVDLIAENERAIAETGTDGANPEVDLQKRRLRISHRLTLLGSRSVKEAYGQYRKLVFRETSHPVQFRPKDPDEVVRARDALIAAMSKDAQKS